MVAIEGPRARAKRLFCAVSFVSHKTGLFERQLLEQPEKEWPSILLSSIIMENCGLLKLRADLQFAAQKLGSGEAYWVAVPNQRILTDQAWLYPVIRACDPKNSIFTDTHYGPEFLDGLSERISIHLKTKDSIVLVDLASILDVLVSIRSDPSITGATPEEIDSTFDILLGELVATKVKQRALTEAASAGASLGESPYAAYSEASTTLLTPPSALFMPNMKDETLRGFLLLVFLMLMFTATGLLLGYYYDPITHYDTNHMASSLKDIS